MAQIVKAPNEDLTDNSRTIFLAGSIDMGKAVNWQQRIENELQEFSNITIYNPRRDDWDSSWVQNISNPQFKEQVTWELDHLDQASLVVFYFDPNGPAPITLLELGYMIGCSKMIVCCPPGYWRRGNVQIICERNHIPVLDNLDDLISEVRNWANNTN